MVMKQLLVRFRERIHAFRVAHTGNVTVIFALATIPIIGAVGAAVDYSHVNSARTAMQAAVDATALKLSKEITTLTTAQINSKATTYFTALYTRPEVTNVSVTPTYTNTDNTQIVVKASGTVKASFTSLIGVSSIQIGASSTVKWGNSRLRVALVLDNTGSMDDDGKIGALKTATKNLLTQLKTAAVNDGDVYVSIIPFVKDVNLGSSNYKATWIDWTDWDANNGTCSGGWGGWGGWGGGGGSTQSSCSGTWKPDNHNTWNGCVTDRGLASGPSLGNYDTNVVAPSTGNTATLFPAEQYSPCPQAVKGLSYDWTSMTTLVNNMTPGGNTNQGIGLALGWMSIAGGGPFTVPAMDSKYKYSQVIILLTDGLNTQNRWYSSQSSIDTREKMTCDNIKAAGVTLYTVQVNTGGDPTSTLLQGCASDKSKFFLLTSANQMISTFSTIGTQLSNLRVAK